MKFGFRGKILLGMAVPVAMLFIIGFVAMNSIHTISESSGKVERAYDVLADASNIVSSAINMETGMRGYLLAGKDGFLEPYNQGKKTTFDDISQLKRMMAGDMEQQSRLDEMSDILSGWQQEVTEPTIKLRRQIGDAKTMNDMAKLVGEARGSKFFNKFRSQIDQFIKHEEKLLKKRRREFRDAMINVRTNLEDDLGGDMGAALEGALVLDSSMKVVYRSYRVIGFTKDLLTAAVDMETGMRGYLLAGKEAFLTP